MRMIELAQKQDCEIIKSDELSFVNLATARFNQTKFPSKDLRVVFEIGYKTGVMDTHFVLTRHPK
jgi:hypothetical protein